MAEESAAVLVRGYPRRKAKVYQLTHFAAWR